MGMKNGIMDHSIIEGYVIDQPTEEIRLLTGGMLNKVLVEYQATIS